MRNSLQSHCELPSHGSVTRVGGVLGDPRGTLASVTVAKRSLAAGSGSPGGRGRCRRTPCECATWGGGVAESVGVGPIEPFRIC